MMLLRRLLHRRSRGSGSELDRLIPAEIRDDPFSRTIAEVAATPGVRHILEIGSSSGDGSTEAFVRGMRQNPGSPVLHCLEVSRVRFAALARRYAEDADVRCYNLSSVPLDRFPEPAEVARFHREVRSRLSRVPLETVLGWLRQDLDYIAAHGLSTPGIREIREMNGIETFDAVLIDGSEFTGPAEMEDVYGARFLLLDDTETYKNYHNARRLAGDGRYRLVAESRRLRNGFAVFERIR